MYHTQSTQSTRQWNCAILESQYVYSYVLGTRVVSTTSQMPKGGELRSQPVSLLPESTAGSAWCERRSWPPSVGNPAESDNLTFTMAKETASAVPAAPSNHARARSSQSHGTGTASHQKQWQPIMPDGSRALAPRRISIAPSDLCAVVAVAAPAPEGDPRFPSGPIGWRATVPTSWCLS